MCAVSQTAYDSEKRRVKAERFGVPHVEGRTTVSSVWGSLNGPGLGGRWKAKERRENVPPTDASHISGRDRVAMCDGELTTSDDRLLIRLPRKLQATLA